MLMLIVWSVLPLGPTVALAVGGIESKTVTDGWQFVLLPDGSVAVQLPDEAPTGNRAVAQLVVQLQLSAQIAMGFTVAPPFSVHCTVWAGQVRTGFSLSVTMTYDVQVAVEPSVPRAPTVTA
jgi:hypothetical protein